MSVKTKIESNTEKVKDIKKSLTVLNNLIDVGDVPNTKEITITSNGTYNAYDGYVGFSKVIVNVPNSVDGNVLPIGLSEDSSKLTIGATYAHNNINIAKKTITDTANFYNIYLNSHTNIFPDTTSNCIVNIRPKASPLFYGHILNILDENGNNTLLASNIKSGVTIWNVTGTYEGSARSSESDIDWVTLDPNDGTNTTALISGSGYDVTLGNGTHAVNVNATDTITIKANAEGGTISIQELADSFTFNVSNLSADKIKQGVTILGVTGTYGGASASSGIILDDGTELPPVPSNLTIDGKPCDYWLVAKDTSNSEYCLFVSPYQWGYYNYELYSIDNTTGDLENDIAYYKYTRPFSWVANNWLPSNTTPTPSYGEITPYDELVVIASNHFIKQYTGGRTVSHATFTNYFEKNN